MYSANQCQSSSLLSCNALGTEHQRIYSVHADRLPSGASNDDLMLIGHLYMISLDPETKVATWACYRATEADAASRNVLTRNWLHALPDATLEKSDYRGPEYDIGHLTPLGTFKASPHAFELNFLANCAPQTPNLNRGPWLKIEELVRDLTHHYAYVDVAVGPLFEREMPPLPAADEPHRVPSHFWTIVTPKDSKSHCFIVDQACERKADPSQYAVSIDELQQRSGLAFPRKPSG